MRFITITLIVHVPDPHTGEQKGGGPIGDDAVPARAVATAGSAAG